MTMGKQASSLQVMGVGSLSEESETIYGLAAPRWFVTTLYKIGVPYSVDVYVRVDPQEGPVPEGIRVNTSPGNHATYKDAVNLLKGARLDRLLHDALLRAANSAAWNKAREALGKPAGQPMTQEEATAAARMAAASTAAAASIPPPVRRRSVTQDLLREVAQVYRAALDAGAPPTQAVANHFITTHSSAARWVREARKSGELGPSQGPMAGEAASASASE
jgi:hypothetical protein